MTVLIVHPTGAPGGSGTTLLTGGVLAGGLIANPVDVTLKTCLYDPSVELAAGYQPIIQKGGSP